MKIKKTAILFLISFTITVLIQVKSSANPLLKSDSTPFGIPDFDKIKVHHFEPAFKKTMVLHKNEIMNIINDKESADFKNTIAALDYSGEKLSYVARIFFNLSSVNTNKEIQAIAKKISPKFSAHWDSIILNPQLFKKVKAVYNKRHQLSLSPEQKRLVEVTYRDFIRNGAGLGKDKFKRLEKINIELTILQLKYRDNTLKDTNAYKLIINQKDDLHGLPQSIVDGASLRAKNLQVKGQWVFTINKASLIPFLKYSSKRNLRKELYEAYTGKGADNKKLIPLIISLRHEKAQILGYKNWAHYQLDRSMAKTSKDVYGLLNKLWKGAISKSKEEAGALQRIANSEGSTFSIAPWDWFYYSEKVRKKKYDLDEEMLRPYFELNNVRDGVFKTARKLFGITFIKRNNVPKYHKDVNVYEVKDKDGTHLGILFMDYFPRQGKYGGAWCTSYRRQYRKNGKNIRPIVSAVFNFTRPTEKLPSLLTYKEVTIFFHEFGHALHNLFSDGTYSRLTGTAVPRDFVEFPSQLMEYFAAHPDVLKLYGRHYKTNRPMPEDLVKKLQRSKYFNKGFATVEYLAASFLDMDYHSKAYKGITTPKLFEKSSMDRIGLIVAIDPRYKSNYFNHIFSQGYSAGYYSYIWSEVFVADTFSAFQNKGTIFDAGTAQLFRKHILSKGYSEEPMKLYVNFRKKRPSITPLLKYRGLKK